MALAVVQLRRGKRLAPDLLPVLLFAALILLMLFSLTLGRYPVPFMARGTLDEIAPKLAWHNQ